MADRRMFSKSIIDSDAFLDMPMTAQVLYFHLSMRADDDGFVNNPKKIQRMIGASGDDFRILVSKQFVIPFDSGIIVIRHWRIHNYIQKDRYKPTLYEREKSQISVLPSGEYSNEVIPELACADSSQQELSDARKKRIEAKKESSLPYSFEYKIKAAFVGTACPICGKTMNYENNQTKPTIQHNVPISMGGKHEIDNISIICMSCNTSIQNKAITPPYNTELVKSVWERIGSVSGMDTQVSIGQVSIGKKSIDKDSRGETAENPPPAPASSGKKKFIPPTLDEVAAYCNERHNHISPSAFIDYYEARGWKYGTGKPMVNWKAAVRTWEQKEKGRTHTQGEQQKNATEEVNARIFEELFGGEPT